MTMIDQQKRYLSQTAVGGDTDKENYIQTEI